MQPPIDTLENKLQALLLKWKNQVSIFDKNPDFGRFGQVGNDTFNKSYGKRNGIEDCAEELEALLFEVNTNE